MTELDIGETRHYRRERYACHLRMSPRRLIERSHRYGEKYRVMGVMNRWLARCVRDQPVVIGNARISTHEDLMTGHHLLRAEANVFLDVHPDDRKVLGTYVDDPNGQMVHIPVLAIPPVRFSVRD